MSEYINIYIYITFYIIITVIFLILFRREFPINLLTYAILYYEVSINESFYYHFEFYDLNYDMYNIFIFILVY